MKKAVAVLVVASVLVSSSIAAQEDSSDVSASDFVFITDRAVVLKSAVWTNKNIPVCWENPQAASDSDRQSVQQSIHETWDVHSGVNFVWSSSKCRQNTPGIHVLIEDSGPRSTKLGNKLNGRRNGVVLNFTYANWSQVCRTSEQKRQSCNKSIAVHEFGHAIGFAHEQNRWDTPGECAVLHREQGQSGDFLLTRWDPNSVMNYCAPVWNNGGVLSQGDIDGVVALYGPN